MLRIILIVIVVVSVWFVWKPPFPEENSLITVVGKIHDITKNIDDDKEDQYSYVTIDVDGERSSLVTFERKPEKILPEGQKVNIGMWQTRELPLIWSAEYDGNKVINYEDVYDQEYNIWLKKKLMAMLAIAFVLFGFLFKQENKT